MSRDLKNWTRVSQEFMYAGAKHIGICFIGVLPRSNSLAPSPLLSKGRCWGHGAMTSRAIPRGTGVQRPPTDLISPPLAQGYRPVPVRLSSNTAGQPRPATWSRVVPHPPPSWGGGGRKTGRPTCVSAAASDMSLLTKWPEAQRSCVK